MLFLQKVLIINQGIEFMFRIAIALLKKNKEIILTLDFEFLLEYLKNGLFEVYSGHPSLLISDASNIHIQKSRLDRLQYEFETRQKAETDPERLALDQLRGQNRNMVDQLRKLEESYELLNREHIKLANESVEKTALIDKLTEKVEELETQCETLRDILNGDRKLAEAKVQLEMDGLMKKNLALTQKNVEMVETLADTTDSLSIAQQQLAEIKIERKTWEQKCKEMESREKL